MDDEPKSKPALIQMCIEIKLKKSFFSESKEGVTLKLKTITKQN